MEKSNKMRGSTGAKSFVRLMFCLVIGILGFLPLAHAQSRFINCGGGDYTDPGGIMWEADKYFNTGNSNPSSVTIAGADGRLTLLQSERWDPPSTPELKYNIPIQNGAYTVKLYFAETYGATTGVGKRVFSVKIENSLVFNNLDIFAETGAGNKALVKETSATVSDSALTIEFIHQIENPSIRAIEVRPVTPTSPSSGTRINVGRASYVDSQGNTWITDAGFVNSGEKYTTPSSISGTPDPTLYKSERWDPPSTPSMKFTIPLPSGSYRVDLGFAETYGPTMAVGARVFDVKIEDKVVFSNFDIYAEVGNSGNKALIKSTTVTVSDGMLLIELLHKVQNPKLCTIAIFPVNAPPPAPQPSPPPGSASSIYINAGGDTYTDNLGRTWLADGPYVNTGTKYLSAASIAGTSDPTIYKTERYDLPDGPEMRYQIPVPSNGQYAIALHFAEIYSSTQGQGKRLFDVKIENSLVFSKIDIFQEGGKDRAYVKSTTVTVNDGVATIEFVHQVENPKICAIELHQLNSQQSPPTRPPTPPPSPASPPPPPPSSGSASFYMNAGGGSFSDGVGNLWQADTQYVNTGRTSSTNAPISGTLIDQLYQSERWDMPTNPALTYNIPLSNGEYECYLHFAETYAAIVQAGRRVFSVKMEGSVVLRDMDIYAEAGERNKAVVKKIDVTVSGGSLQIEFIHNIQNPTVCGIEIHPKTTASSSIVAINVGGPNFTDGTGKLWLSDVGYYDTGLVSSANAPISGTSVQTILQSERYGEMTFTIPLQNGLYDIDMLFAETYAGITQAGQRKFNVKIEGSTIISNLDVFAETGGRNRALIKSQRVSVNDGNLNIQFIPVVQNPMINGIEVKGVLGGAPPPPPPVDSPLAVPKFQSIYINCGSGTSTQGSGGITWKKDEFFNTGKSYSPKNIPSISGAGNSQAGTKDSFLYQSERFDDVLIDPDLIYEIPVPDGVFEVRLHFADIYSKTWQDGARVFDVLLEGVEAFSSLDIYKEVGANVALTKIANTNVKDGFLTIEFRAIVENPKINAIEVHAVGELSNHFAHAVPGGPYYQTNTLNQPSVPVQMDGTFSHTHASGAVLTSWVWKKTGSNQVIGTGEKPILSFPVGVHDLTLTVTDSVGDVASDVTTVTIRPFGYPDVESLTPDSGEFASSQEVIITGSGFNSVSFVRFGDKQLNGGDIQVINQTTIKVIVAPLGTTSGAVPVSVTTPLGESNAIGYTYFDGVPVSFSKGTIKTSIFGPTTLAFDQKGRLYVGTQGGDIIRFTLDDNFNVIDELTSSIVSQSEPPYRTILGIAFDPTEKNIEEPTVYVASNFLFHGLIQSFNGKINAVSGANLDKIENIITGLPISDHDHGVNGLEFDDNGNLYIQIGGNTNAGVPGELSSSGLQKEDYLSAATLVAPIKKPGFNGNVEYTSNGYLKPGIDVRVFASGQRNPFDIVFHSNGHLYATDNGPNFNFGDASLSCNSQGPDPKDKDELNLIEDGNYYGHPNRLRGQTDPRQCVYRNFDDPQGNTPAIKKLESSSNGITEFQTAHFGGQLRGQLIIGRYKGALYHVKLSSDGKGALFRESIPPKLVSSADGGLDVVQGPDGSLFVAQNDAGSVIYHKPNEPASSLLKVLSVYPRRGHIDGGTTLSIYGLKFGSSAAALSVIVGGRGCPVISAKDTKITCTLPAGIGKTDVVVTNSQALESDTLKEAYRYITGVA